MGPIVADHADLADQSDHRSRSRRSQACLRCDDGDDKDRHRNDRGGAPRPPINERVAVKIVVFALLGAIVGYYAGAYPACMWLWPEMNLCGLTGVFITGPIGMIVGAVIGWRRQRSAGD